MRISRHIRVLAMIAVIGLLGAACGGDDGPVSSGSSDDGASTASAPAASDTGSATSSSETSDSEAAGEMGDEVDLTLGHPFPAAHVIQAQVLDDWAAEVAEATDGTVNIEIIPGGGLGPAPAMYENTVAGAQDLGWALHGYTAGRFPIMQIVEMPFAFDSATQATETLWDLYEEFPEFQEEYADVKVLAQWTHDTGDLWTAGTQVTTADDMGGLTLRAPGPLQQQLITELGGAPVAMPAPEIFDSIERGVIDGVMISNSGVDSFSLYDVLDFGVDCDCYVAAMFLTMNQSSWDALSPAQQEAIDGLSGRDLSLRAAGAYDEDSEANQSLIEEAGIELTALEGDELTRWEEAGQRVADSWIAARESEGVPGQQMYDRLLELTGN